MFHLVILPLAFNEIQLLTVRFLRLTSLAQDGREPRRRPVVSKAFCRIEPMPRPNREAFFAFLDSHNQPSSKWLWRSRMLGLPAVLRDVSNDAPQDERKDAFTPERKSRGCQAGRPGQAQAGLETKGVRDSLKNYRPFFIYSCKKDIKCVNNVL